MNDLKSILSKILASTPNYDERMKEMQIYDAWPRAVGERVAKHCWPVRVLDKKILLVAAESSAWLHQLRYLERQILEKLEKELRKKTITQLRFKLAAPEAE